MFWRCRRMLRVVYYFVLYSISFTSTSYRVRTVKSLTSAEYEKYHQSSWAVQIQSSLSPQNDFALSESGSKLERKKVKLAQHETLKAFSRRAARDVDSPKLVAPWYLKKRVGHNVKAVWDRGFNGRNILIGVIDNGLRHTHEEFRHRYVAEASYDFVGRQNLLAKGHGTSCAGIIAGAAANSLCGIGVAFEARIAGIRLFEGKQATDENEAKAFYPAVKGPEIDIFSSSWGIPSSGYAIGGPRKLAQNALKNGAEKGRKGLGYIYVFAAGNGGMFGDSCSFNGYVNSIYTIPVAGVRKNQKIHIYSPPCAAIMTAAYAEQLVKLAQHETLKAFSRRAARDVDSPKLVAPWYLKKRVGHNVKAVWDRGFNGRNILIGVIDNGLRHTHEEFKHRYVAEASYDFVGRQNLLAKGHGTSCAGIIAGAAANSLCGIGVAFEARIAGIRLFEGKQATDENEAKAFYPAVKGPEIDIFSSSWGIPSSGYAIGGPRKLAQNALKNGAEKGRKGLGYIYVFAAGNGGMFGDSCSFNGYVNSIYTIPVAGIRKNQKIHIYSPPCAAIMTAAYAEQLVTASSFNDTACRNFGYTSGATAIVSGIIALGLQANKNLSWRDIQHLIARSSKAYVEDNDDANWIANMGGFNVSERVGFGVIDALKFVQNAQKWRHNAPKQIKCEERMRSPKILKNSITTVVLHVDPLCRIFHLEHVQLKVDLVYSHRGLIAADLTSPGRTSSRMLHPRPFDVITRAKNYTDWVTTSVQFWGERAHGNWRVTFQNGLPSVAEGNGTLFSMSLILYGTETAPEPRNVTFNGSENTEPTTLPKHTTTRETSLPTTNGITTDFWQLVVVVVCIGCLFVVILNCRGLRFHRELQDRELQDTGLRMQLEVDPLKRRSREHTKDTADEEPDDKGPTDV